MTFTKGMADAGAGPFIGDLAGGGVPAAPDRMREHCQPADGAGIGTQPGICRAARARRRPCPPVQADAARRAGDGGVPLLLAMPLTAIGLGLSRASIPASVLRFIPGWAFIRVDLQLFLVTAASAPSRCWCSRLFRPCRRSRAGVRHAAAVGAQPDARPSAPMAAQRARDHAGRPGAGVAVWLDTRPYGSRSHGERRARIRQAERAGRHHQPSRADLCRSGEAAAVSQRRHGRHARHSGGDRRRCHEQHSRRLQQQRPGVLSRRCRTAAIGGSLRQLPHRVQRIFQRVEDSVAARALVRGHRSAPTPCRWRW